MKSKILASEAAIKSATLIRDLSHELADRRAAMEKEVQQKCDEVIEAYKTLEAQVVAEVEVEWGKLCSEMGIHESEREAWHLNAQFLTEHGLAFVVFDEEKARHLAMIQARLVEDRHKH